MSSRGGEKIKQTSLRKWWCQKSLLRRDRDDEAISSCYDHIRFEDSLVQRCNCRVQLYLLIAVDRNQRSAGRSTCSTWMSDPLIPTSFRTFGMRSQSPAANSRALFNFCRGRMAENDRVGSGDQARVRSCPLYSTCFTANIAVPASPKCGNSFCSRLPTTKSREQIGMPAILPALMIGMPAWVTTSRRRSPNHPVAASARSASPLGTYTPLEDRAQLETQRRSPRVTHRPASGRARARTPDGAIICMVESTPRSH
ncbi:hypothetical protein ACVWVY_002198 [Bradyrhizobium sp. URHC0002]